MIDHRLLRLSLLCLLALAALPAGPAQAANDFSADTHCVIVWNLEDAALTTDSGPVGTNTLSTNSTVTADTGVYMQGAASGRWNSAESDTMRILDAELSAGCSLKSGYAPAIQVTVCLWFRADTSTANTSLFNKYTTSPANSRQLRINFQSTNTIFVTVGGSDEDNTTYNVAHASTLSDDTWYHLTVGWDDATKTTTIRLRNAAGQAVGSDVTDSGAAYTMGKKAGPVTIGSYNGSGDFLDGYLDEVVVFNDLLTDDEVRKVAKGLYGNPNPDIPHRGWMLGAGD
jgi:hypothetical protein